MKGTITADLAESVNLKELLSQSGYDSRRYEPIGIDISLNDGKEVVCVISIDNYYSTPNKTYISKCRISNPFFIFASLFNNLSISLIQNNLDTSELRIKESITVYRDKNTANDSDDFSYSRH